MSQSEQSKAVFEDIKTVLAVREYVDKPIPADALQRIAEAAHLTASSQNKQPWHFLVVQDKDTLKQLGAWATHGSYIADAAAAILVVIPKGRVADAARAIQSIVLQAWAEGIGSNWVGAIGLEPAKELLGIPDDLEIAAVVPLGYPAKPGGKGIKNRKPFGEVVFSEKWDAPFGASR